MGDTLRQLVGHLRLHCPDLPVTLAEAFIRNRYRTVLDRRHWSGLRQETQILTRDAYSAGTVTVTTGSPLVHGLGVDWSDQLGRQFMVGAVAPVYTVAEVVSPTTLRLDQVFGGASKSDALYRLLDAYWTAPEGFLRFLTVLDPLNAWHLKYWVQQEEIAHCDPQRTASGTPWCLVDRRRVGPDHRAQFELWPYTLSARVYNVLYYISGQDLQTDIDEPLPPIRGDVIIKGALADACRWPGTLEKPNLLFGKAIELSRTYEQEFADQVEDMAVEDETLFLTELQAADWNLWPSAPFDAKWMQAHA